MCSARAAIYLFHDRDGRVDAYVARALASLRPHVERLLVVVNGPLSSDGRAVLEAESDEVLVRDNRGFDVGGYTAGLERLGWESLADFDELLLLNNTFFAPVNPWEPVFERAAANPEASFWGLTEHGDLSPHPFLARPTMARHIQSHFIAVRRRLLIDPRFREYWQTMPPIESYRDSIVHHETRFTEYFESLGHEGFAVFPAADYVVPNAAILRADALMEAGCPLLKRRIFFEDPLYMRQNGVDGARLVEAAVSGGYDEDVLVSGVVRAASPRTLLATAGLTEIVAPAAAREPSPSAVVAHAHAASSAALTELVARAARLPEGARLVLTCADDAVRFDAERRFVETGIDARARTVTMRGAGALAALIADIAAEVDEDAIVVHLGDLEDANRRLDADILDGALSLFSAHDSLGLVVLGRGDDIGSAPASQSRAGAPGLTEIARRAGIGVPLDPAPLTVIGAPFVVRCRGLAPLAALIAEARSAVGESALAALLAPSCAQQGLHTRRLLMAVDAAIGYGALEYRVSRIDEIVPGGPLDQIERLRDRGVRARLRRALVEDHPQIARTLTPAARRVKGAIKGLRGRLSSR